MIIKSIIFFAIMFFVIYRFGNIVSKLVGDKEKENNLLYGFLLLIGINQIILTPCILIHTSFKIAFCLVFIKRYHKFTLHYIFLFYNCYIVILKLFQNRSKL